MKTRMDRAWKLLLALALCLSLVMPALTGAAGAAAFTIYEVELPD